MKTVYEKKTKKGIRAELKKETETNVQMVYLTGELKQQFFTIAKSTLRRYWKLVEGEDIITADEIVTGIDGVDDKVVNEPYNPKVEPKYIPVPQSVIEYENLASVRRNGNVDLPNEEKLLELFKQNNIEIGRINKYYIKLVNKWIITIKKRSIEFCIQESYIEQIVGLGFKVEPYKWNKEVPIKFSVSNMAELNKIIEVIKNV